MTFEIPDDVAERFEKEVPADEQSVEVTRLLRRRVPRPKLTEEQWAEACEAVNTDPDIVQLERDMDALHAEGLDEYPWTEPTSR